MRKLFFSQLFLAFFLQHFFQFFLHSFRAFSPEIFIKIQTRHSLLSPRFLHEI